MLIYMRLQASGFHRLRMRKVGASSCAQDPLGAGQYVFTGVRWLDPDDPQDAACLASGIMDFLHRHEHLNQALCPVRLVNVLRSVIATWRESRTHHATILHGRVDVSTACFRFLPTSSSWTSSQHYIGVMPKAEHAQLVALPYPASRSEECFGQTCERLAAIAGADRSNEAAAVSAESAAAWFAARPAQPLSFLPPPSLPHPSLLAGRSEPIAPTNEACLDEEHSPKAILGSFFPDALQDSGSFFLADPFPAVDDECCGWVDGAAGAWTADLPPAGDAGEAWETFDALLPLILRGCT